MPDPTTGSVLAGTPQQDDPPDVSSLPANSNQLQPAPDTVQVPPPRPQGPPSDMVHHSVLGRAIKSLVGALHGSEVQYRPNAAIRLRRYSYRKLEPVGLSMALVADAVHSMKAGDPEVVSQSKVDTAVNHIARSLKDVSFLPTLSNLLEALENPGSRAEKFVSQQAGALVPAIVKDVAQTIDPTVRKPTGVVETIESRVPGLTQNVPPVVEITGKQ